MKQMEQVCLGVIHGLPIPLKGKFILPSDWQQYATELPIMNS